jgi:predicted NUDIX family NTP pyrophosphohydrolase
MRVSAGILPFHSERTGLRVLLAHPGGPFWSRRDTGAWTIVKGECLEHEEPEQAARREFSEETGWSVNGTLLPLGTVRQKSGKLVYCFAANEDFDPLSVRSNTFELEWPPRSGRIASFPEIDRVQWFDMDSAQGKILQAQRPFLTRLRAIAEG